VLKIDLSFPKKNGIGCQLTVGDHANNPSVIFDEYLVIK